MPKAKLDIDFSRQNVVSYSQYSIYSQCEYRWYLAYVKKHKIPDVNMNLVFGTSIHEAVQHYLSVFYSETATKANQIDLNVYFKDRLVENYKATVESNKFAHFSNAQEFQEYYEDGVQILNYLKSKRGTYFSKRGTKLKGVELPLLTPVSEQRPDVFITAYLDLVFIFDDGTHEILDIKTSTRGWKDKDKKDTTKIAQLLVYKRFYSQKYKVSEDKINVKFLILKRKIYENSEFPISRIQEFIPAQGKKKVDDAVNSMKLFVESSFVDKGKYNVEREYKKNFSSCIYCPYKDRSDLCNREE